MDGLDEGNRAPVASLSIPPANAYVVGTTDDDGFGSFPAPQVTPDVGGYSVFVVKLNPQGGTTYRAEVGGNEPDSLYQDYNGADNIGNDIAVDAAGDAYVTGNTCSDSFPTVNPYQAQFLGETGTGGGLIMASTMPLCSN